MPQIQIMIVDDSLVVRKVLTNVLSSDPDLAIAGWASNGRLALAKLQTLRPDIILLDIEMPEMNGLETIPGIRKILPHTPIIMFSTLTERGAEATLDALALGASDYVAKPSNQNMAATSEAIHRDLVPKIKALCHFPARTQIRRRASRAPSVATPAARDSLSRCSFAFCQLKIVAIGVSTGGPDALAKLLPSFPANFPLPVVIAQHMPRHLHDAPGQAARHQVRACRCGSASRAICSAPLAFGSRPATTTWWCRKKNAACALATHQGPRENFCRPSVDVLFRSVAAVYGANALGVILTGMGQDGLKGCEALCAAGSLGDRPGRGQQRRLGHARLRGARRIG